MNQGATEMLLALNLSSRMVGTAYLDDEIWPEVAAKYSEIPVLTFVRSTQY
jgi:iron complex transport system substrate-binding protein